MSQEYNITFVVPGNPVALKRHRTLKKGFSYDPSANDKADFLAKAMQYRPDIPFDGPISLTIVCFFKRPKSHYRAGKFSHQLKDTAPVWHTSTPDGDNLLKFVGDALNGIFWRDDKFIAVSQVIKKYDESPRVAINIRLIENDSMDYDLTPPQVFGPSRARAEGFGLDEIQQEALADLWQWHKDSLRSEILLGCGIV